MRALALIGACLGIAGPAAAQPAAPAPRPEPPPEVAAPVEPAPAAPAPELAIAPAIDPRLDAGWQLYHDAFAALLGREPRRARTLTTRLLREHPGHPAAITVERSRAALGLDAAGPADRVADARDEAPSKGARAELALFQGIHGIALGIELALLFESDSAASYLLLGLGGGLAGGLVAVEAVPEVTSGKRALPTAARSGAPRMPAS